MLSGSGSVVYGPFHRRRNQNTQSDAVALKQQQSQEIWGAAARWSPFRSVKAYRGQLPAGSQGIEFMTAVMPSGNCPYNVYWYEGAAGVSINSQGYAVIRVAITKRVP
jgi:hypothetical protein